MKMPAFLSSGKTKEATAKRSHHSFDWASIGVSTVGLVVFGYGVVTTWHALRADDTATSVTAVATATPTPALPALTLNAVHARQGAVIQVDPGEIGRSDPFVK